MALKDMKSDLSKFRMPKKTPLESKDRVKIDKTQNQTPLSSMAESAPKIPRSQTTTNKEGVNPQKVNQSEKFKGETSPQPMDNSEKFKGETSPQPMSLEERFLGQTEPTKLDNSEKFLGETSPQPMDNSEKFLGETTPSPMDTSEQYLGETTPKSKDNTGQFLGETNPKPMSLEERYLGETTPTDKDSTGQFLGETNPNIVQQGDKFKGETEPNKFNNTSNFVRFSNEQISSPLATEPNQMNLDAKFLGETNPNPSDVSSKFLGETTPNPSDVSSKFLGETTPTEMDEQTGDKFLGETTPNVTTLGDKFKGETTPARFPYILRQETQGKEPSKVNYIEDLHANGFTSNMYPIGGPKKSSQFIGVDPSQTQFDGATSLYGTLGLTNFIVDDDATGFTKDMFPIGSSKKPSQFTGVDSAGTVFDEKSSEYSNTKSLYNGLSYRPGYGRFKFDKETGNVQRYSESNKYLVDTELTRMGISQLQEMRSSPSFLDEMYHKFNLRDDAFNLGTAAFAHPLILRGIQRKKISKGEPQKWGFGFPIDDGLVRGGIVTATDRAVVDAVRLGKWMVSVQGLLWGIKQLGLQQSTSNVETITGKRKTKIWTPINTLAATLGGFAGLHPNRHGITPFDLTEGTYSEVLNAKRTLHIDDITLTNGPSSNRLVNKWNKEFQQLPNGDVKDKGDGSKLLDKLKNAFRGGPNSLYGLGDFAPNQSTENTIPDKQDGELGRTYNQKKQYNPTAAGPNTSGVKGKPFDRAQTTLAKGNEISPELNVLKKDYLDKKLPKELERPTSLDGRVYNTEEKYYEGSSKPSDLKEFADGTNLGLNANNLPGSFFNNEIKTDGKSHAIEKNDSAGEVLRNYETIAYGNIPTRPAGGSNNSFLDFRSLLTGDEKKRAEAADYSRKNIHSGRIGFAEYGAGRDLTNPSDGLNSDPVISSGIGDGETSDLVHFWVQEEAEGASSKLQFRGTVTGLTDTFSPSWDSVKFSGRADQGYKYGTFERSLSFNFQVYATSRDDMQPMWRKLQRLSTMTMPQYQGSEGYQGTLVKFRVGDLYNGKLAFIESLTYTISDEAPWDLNIDGNLGELPMGIDVAIGFKVLGDQRPQYKQEDTYDWSF